jgi:hypothetical protein
VLPLDNSRIERFDVSLRPSLTRGRTEFTYYPGMVRIPEGTAPDFKNKSYRIIADVEIPEAGAEGVLMTQGGWFNGLGLYVLQGKPVFHYNLVGVDRTTVAGNDSLTPGKHNVTVDFKYDSGGIGKGGAVTLTVDGKEVANGKLTRKPSRSVFRQMKPSTSARTPARPLARTTTCRSSSPGRSIRLSSISVRPSSALKNRGSWINKRALTRLLISHAFSAQLVGCGPVRSFWVPIPTSKCSERAKHFGEARLGSPSSQRKVGRVPK